MDGIISAAQEAQLADLGDAPQLAESSEQLVQEIRVLGRVPRCVKGSSEPDKRERKLAHRLRSVRKAGNISADQEVELADLGDAPQLADSSEEQLQEIRALGRVPRCVQGSSAAQVRERKLAWRLRSARKAGDISSA